MDQIKIGKFIQELRKEKKLTQRELAEALSISDKTISKWETGKGMPEISLMLPLCEALNISVNELLSAQRFTPSEYHQKAEEHIMDLMNEKQENKKKIALSVIVAVICILSSLTSSSSPVLSPWPSGNVFCCLQSLLSTCSAASALVLCSIAKPEVMNVLTATRASCPARPPTSTACTPSPDACSRAPSVASVAFANAD